MYVSRSETRITQGDFIEEYPYSFSRIVGRELLTDEITFPYVVVLTQDCDLEWDFKTRNDVERKNNDKFLQSLLICPAYLAEQLRLGKHLEGLQQTMESWPGDLWKHIKKNGNERFHFLPAYKQEMPDLVIDFKHFYTVPRNEAYSAHEMRYKLSLDVLFREDLSQRFAHYLSRIGLPEPVRGALDTSQVS